MRQHVEDEKGMCLVAGDHQVAGRSAREQKRWAKGEQRVIYDWMRRESGREKKRRAGVCDRVQEE